MTTVQEIVRERYLRDRPKKVTHCTKLKVAKSVTTGLTFR